MERGRLPAGKGILAAKQRTTKIPARPMQEIRNRQEPRPTARIDSPAIPRAPLIPPDYTPRLARVAAQGRPMYKVLEPVAQLLSALAIPLALLTVFEIMRFPFGAW